MTVGEDVASRAEAWIETARAPTRSRPRPSPPARRRGSKQARNRRPEGRPRVASRAEAWVETTAGSRHPAGRASPPARRRGSKHRFPQSLHLPRHVASRAEAWVETAPACGRSRRDRVASRAEAWVQTSGSAASTRSAPVASRAEAWVETSRRVDCSATPAVASRAEAFMLPLDGCLSALQPSIPHLTRFSAAPMPATARHSPLAGHRRGQAEAPALQTLSDRLLPHRSRRGPDRSSKLYLFVGIDRASTFAVTQLVDKGDRQTAWEFLEHLLKAVPYRVHAILSDNGTQFAEQPRNWNTAWSRRCSST